MLTRRWLRIADHFETCGGQRRSTLALAPLARRISDRRLTGGLVGSTSMLGLLIAQIATDDTYDGPFLRLSPISDDQIEFRYVDTYVTQDQWHRTVDADQVWARLIKFLDQLRWFPPQVLEPLSSNAPTQSY
jgi:hypothetical protein